MSERKINLEEILTQENKTAFNEEGYYNYFTAMQQSIIKKAMLEFGKQLLELAAKNTEHHHANKDWVDKQSILNTIKQIKY